MGRSARASAGTSRPAELLARGSAAVGASDGSLSAVAWSRFHRGFWERRGTVLRAPLPVPLTTADHVFEQLIAAAERWRAGDRSFAPEFCVEHAQILADVGRFLPSPADSSVAAWVRRVTEMLQGRAFGLVVDDYQTIDEPVWRRLRDFVRPLYAFTGLPGDQAKAALFLGNYHRTPFGLHRGRSGNFMFVLDGVKRIRAWPDEFFRGKEDLTNRLDYARYNDASVVLEGRARDVIYWPSPYWHIGEDAGQLTIAISLALFMEPRPWAEVLAAVADGLEPRLKRRRADVGGSIRALRAIADDPALELRLTAARFNRQTGFGFLRVPAPAPARPLRDEDLVRGDPDASVRWARVGGDIVCSANGHSFAVPADPRVPALLRRLNSGVEARVGDLVAMCSGDVERDGVTFTAKRRHVHALLQRLHSLRAIRRGERARRLRVSATAKV